MVDIIPDVIQCIIVLGFSLGFLIGESGSKFDEEVKYKSGKAWFDSLHPFIKYCVDFLLNLSHHFQYGLALIIIGHLYCTGLTQLFLWYAGWGLIISDSKDYKQILKRLGLGLSTSS